MSRHFASRSAPWLLLCCLLATQAYGQTAIEFDGAGFRGVIHDNVSNKKRQGSGFTPLMLDAFPTANLFRDDAVGMNFEHIFNGAKAQHDILRNYILFCIFIHDAIIDDVGLYIVLF